MFEKHRQDFQSSFARVRVCVEIVLKLQGKVEVLYEAVDHEFMVESIPAVWHFGAGNRKVHS